MYTPSSSPTGEPPKRTCYRMEEEERAFHIKKREFIEGLLNPMPEGPKKYPTPLQCAQDHPVVSCMLGS